MELTCKKLGPNLKNWVRFWDLKIWRNWDFASPWLTKIAITRSILEIEGSSFGFSLIFVCSKNHILQLKLSNGFLNDPIFYTPLPRGGRVKHLNSIFFQNFSFWYLGKVTKFQMIICMRLGAIIISARGGYQIPPPWLIGLRSYDWHLLMAKRAWSISTESNDYYGCTVCNFWNCYKLLEHFTSRFIAF